eukprot:TRINITY_DN1283_c0_g1_i1.p1 TRINITY_DN1283_c0_g1~~TRINITY_DN1283_c0_g1_i1.p1  ORF type:complete len:126 (-),score=34.86 TRINITY_DN1283_c0_g1_i1:87-464(-)
MAYFGKFGTESSKSLREAGSKVLRLYRNALREAPQLIRSYQLELTPKQVQQRIREDFVKNKTISDTQIVDMLVFKGELELEEVKMMWKTKSHVLRYFVPKKDTDEHQSEFLKSFLEQERLLKSRE